MSAYLDWKVGDSVVCVSQPEDKGWGYERPIVNHVYTLRRIGVSVAGAVTVKLNEIVNPEREYPSARFGPLYGEIGFQAKHFRPVIKRTTDISIFRALLNPTEDETFRELEAAEFEYQPTEVPFR